MNHQTTEEFVSQAVWESCFVLFRRLLEHVNSLNILHNSQIVFLPKNRTADHVLTLRTLVDKYVHHHKEKIYACFVDFKKAFDSV